MEDGEWILPFAQQASLADLTELGYAALAKPQWPQLLI